MTDSKPVLSSNQGVGALKQVGSAVIVNLGSNVAESAAALAGIGIWARSPDIYATILATQPFASAPNISVTDLATLAALAWRIDCFPKPMVALLDHPLSSTQIALTTVATHRVGGPNYRFTIPPLEVFGGGLPLGGIAQTLARLPGSMGMYLALTGHALAPSDSLALGLLTHTVAGSVQLGVVAGLADNQPVDPLLDALHIDPGPSELLTRADVIAQCFSAASPNAILDALAGMAGPHVAWADATRAAIEKQSPLARDAIYRLITKASHLDVRQGLILSHAVAANWRTQRAASATDIDEIFFSNKNASLTLPERSEIANGRF